MKRYFLLFVLAAIYATTSMAQKKAEFRQAQARVQEPEMAVYVKPLIVDLKVINGQKRMEAGPFIFEDKDVTTMSFDDLKDTKTLALYLASKQLEADVIVAATFDIRTREKGKGLEIMVTGYPAIYSGWRNIEEKDYQWVRDAYGMEKGNAALKKVQAIENK